MKSMKILVLGVIVAFSATMYSCEFNDIETGEVELKLPTTPYQYFVGENDNLPTLGRVLFYDPRLSVNNSVSCGTCHKQAMAFADGKDLSLGFENKRTGRNSMPIQNIIGSFFSGGIDSLGGIIKPGGGIEPFPGGIIIDPGGLPFANPTALFWDGRQKSLHKMVMEPIANHIEMGTTNFEHLALKLAAIPEYPNLFNRAFVDGQINPDNIATALSAFLMSIRANDSKFDRMQQGQAALNGLEEIGKNLFFDTYDCNSCHQLQAPFNGYQLAGEGEFGGFADIGLDDKPADGGVFRVSGNTQDFGKFKIPSLRNIALTAPYMHDGRLETLEDVIDHYSENIQGSENLDHRLRNADGSPKQFNIPAADKRAIIAFLNTMTDYTMIRDPKFSNPFRAK